MDHKVFYPAVFAFTAISAFYFPTFATAKCPKPLKVGWELSQPYQFLSNGKVVGIDMEILDLTIGKMGCELEKIEMSWKRLLAEVESGKMQIAAGASPTEDRKKYSWMSTSYKEEPVTLYIRKSDRKKFKPNSMQELTSGGHVFGVMAAAYNGPEFDRLKNEGKFKVGENLIEVNSEKNLILGLVNGRFDGVFLGADVVNFNKNIMAYKKSFFVSDTVFMFSKKSVDENFVNEFSKTLTELKGSGQIKKIIQKNLNNSVEKYSSDPIDK